MPKQKRPAVMGVNREARNLAFQVRLDERKRVAAGHAREYWFDMEDRPFMSDRDVFCIDNPMELYEYTLADRQWCRPWRIRHLAVAAACLDEVLDVPRREDDPPSGSPPPRTGWDALTMRCLKFFRDLETISVVFGPTYATTGREVQTYDDFSESHGLVWSSDIPDVRLVQWAAGSTEDAQARVDGLLDRARAGVALVLEKCARRREEMRRFKEEVRHDREWGMIGSPWRYDAADLITRDHVTVQARRMVKLGEFRGRHGRRY